MYRVTVGYGRPTDTAAFDEHYAAVHAPLAAKIPGLARYTGGTCSALDGSEAAYYYVAHLDFDSKASLDGGLASPEMQAAAADVATFATGGVTMFVQSLDDLT